MDKQDEGRAIPPGLRGDLARLFSDRGTIGGRPGIGQALERAITRPGPLALVLYRASHALWVHDSKTAAEILWRVNFFLSGADIHPAAEIGEHFFIDHGTGIVIGETTIIGDHVKLYQGVTLGALSVDKAMASVKRHPTVEDHVIIYSGATILGGETIIGHNSIIGGNVWLTKSVPSCSTVYHRPDIEVVEQIKS